MITSGPSMYRALGGRLPKGLGVLDPFFNASPTVQVLSIIGVLVALGIFVVVPVFIGDWLATRRVVREALIRNKLADPPEEPAAPAQHRRPPQGLAPLGQSRSMFHPSQSSPRPYANQPPPTPQTAPQPEEAAVSAEPTPLPNPPEIPETALPDRLMVPAPEIEIDGETVTLYEWARRSRGDARTLFQEIVADFYTAVLTDQRVASYFPGREGIGTLRAHFANAFLMLSRDGLWLSTANHLARAHRDVRNEAGEPITSEAFDIVISHLVNVLTEIKYSVPNTPECLGRLSEMVGLAKTVIAVEPEPEPV